MFVKPNKQNMGAAVDPQPILLCCRGHFALKSMLPLGFFMPPAWNEPEPRLAAIQQPRNTMLVGRCLGDYNQATWEAARKRRWTVERGEDGEAELKPHKTQPRNVQNETMNDAAQVCLLFMELCRGAPEGLGYSHQSTAPFSNKHRNLSKGERKYCLNLYSIWRIIKLKEQQQLNEHPQQKMGGKKNTFS